MSCDLSDPNVVRSPPNIELNFATKEALRSAGVGNDQSVSFKTDVKTLNTAMVRKKLGMIMT